jgi:hypothetical protein
MTAQIRLYRVLINKVMVFIQKEKNACTDRFFAFNEVVMFFFSWPTKRTFSGENFLCCDRFVVDLQSRKNPGGSTTVPFSLCFLQPSMIHFIDGIFEMAYTGLALFLKSVDLSTPFGVCILPIRN